MNSTISLNHTPYKLDYYHPDDKYSFLFTQVPDFLFEDPACRELSNNAKLLYSKLLRETRQAAKKGNIDTDGHLYIDFSLSQTCNFLNCSEATAKRVRKELRDCFGDGIGLVKYVSHGQGRPDYVYVINYIPLTDSGIPSESSQSNPKPIIDPSREVKDEPSEELRSNLSRELKSDPYINDSKKSYVSNCAKAIINAISIATDKEDFITLLNKAGWSVQWENSRKHIVFQNESGQKVRDSNIEKTFPGLKISKESLSEEFSKHIVSVQEPPVINHAPDSGPIATDNKPETPSKQDQKRVSFKEKLAQKKKEADLFNREHTSRRSRNPERTVR